ncbi:MAG: hypothetical protein ACI8V5_001925 [Limisphaerales bacterium]|jgi:hypothetical protein
MKLALKKFSSAAILASLAMFVFSTSTEAVVTLDAKATANSGNIAANTTPLTIAIAQKIAVGSSSFKGGNQADMGAALITLTDFAGAPLTKAAMISFSGNVSTTVSCEMGGQIRALNVTGDIAGSEDYPTT